MVVFSLHENGFGKSKSFADAISASRLLSGVHRPGSNCIVSGFSGGMYELLDTVSKYWLQPVNSFQKISISGPAFCWLSPQIIRSPHYPAFWDFKPGN
jgi:hypothetical protein